MRLATFNLENLDEGPELPARIAVLRPQLLRLAADVLCLQEVDAQRPSAHAPRVFAALDALLAGTPYADMQQVGTRSIHPGSGAMDVHNLVVLSRLPVLAEAQLKHDLVAPAQVEPPGGGPAEAVTFDRPLLHVTLAWEGRPLHVLNLHLRAPLAVHRPGAKAGPFAWTSVEAWAHGFYLAAVKRSAQALEARRLVSRLLQQDPDARVAVCGDFNAELTEMPLRLLIAGEDDLGTGDLAAEALVPLTRGLPASLRHSVIHLGRPQMLDHILVSRALLARFARIEVHNEALADERVAYGRTADRRASYHAPVLAVFAGTAD